MPNNLSSNQMTKVKKGFVECFDARQVISKAVNTSLITGDHDASTGDTVYLKRPQRSVSVETATGDLTGVTQDIIAGRAAATVQNYISVVRNWTNKEETLSMDELKEELLDDAASELVLKLERNLYGFMQRNSGLLQGTPGTAVTAWSHIAGAGTLLDSMGVDVTKSYYIMNPATRESLADVQRGLASGSPGLVDDAFTRFKLNVDFGGLTAMSSNNMGSYQSGASTARTGTVLSAPDQTYVTAKDTMTQTITLAGLTASVTNAVRAGDLIRVTQAGRTRINPLTREIIFDKTGVPIQYTFVVVTGGNSNASGQATVTVSAAAINEVGGAYNNISTAIQAGDTFSLLGALNATYQPNLFFHKNAFALSSVKVKELRGGVECSYMEKGGLSIRVAFYADGTTNTQRVRFDMLPVFSCINPMAAGNAFGG